MPMTMPMGAPMLSPLAYQNPSLIAQQQQIQQAQMYAQALRQQAFEPIPTDQPLPGGYIAKVTPAQVLAKLLTGYGTKVETDKANQMTQSLVANQADMMRSLFGGSAPMGSPAAAPVDPDAASAAALGAGATAQPNTPAPDGTMTNNGGVGPTNANAVRMGQVLAGGPPQDPTQGAPQAPQQGGMQMPGMSPQQSMLAYSMSPDGYVKAYLDAKSTSTDFVKTLRAAGIDPASAQGQQLIQANIAKQNNIPLTRLTQGGALADNQGNIKAVFPRLPDGSLPQIVNGQVAGVTPMPGAAQVQQTMSAASALGTAGAKPVQVWDPTANGGKGGMVFSTAANVVQAANSTGGQPPGQANAPVQAAQPSIAPAGVPPQAVGAQPIGVAPQVQPTGATPVGFPSVSPAVQMGRNADQLRLLQAELTDPTTNPTDIPAIQREIARVSGANATGQPFSFSANPSMNPGQGAPSGPPSMSLPPPKAPMAAAPPLGAAESAETAASVSQTALQKKIDDVTAGAAAAPTVIARLQSIDGLADKAVSGAEVDRRDFLNGLLSLGGIGNAPDAKTASDLLDKNSAQIVAALRMGSTGGGSDALQTLLGAGNPNRTMTAPAIHEAVAQLISNQQLNQAKAKVLLPLQGARDPAAYAQTEATFNANADPRIWQFQNIQNPAQRSAFAASVLKQDPQFPAKIKALESIGAL